MSLNLKVESAARLSIAPMMDGADGALGPIFYWPFLTATKSVAPIVAPYLTSPSSIPLGDNANYSIQAFGENPCGPF